MISRQTIDMVFQTANIVDVIGDYVPLRRRGSSYIGLCPFHNEKTPSFHVVPSKNLFKCFGCGKGGGVHSFLMEAEQIQFGEAIRMLARRYNIDIIEQEQTKEQKEHTSLIESMYIANQFAADYFIKTLFETDEGKQVALSYLQERKISPERIRQYGLGYSPEARDAFANEALKAGYSKELLEKTGLVIFRDNWRADRFQERIIFPIHGISGKIIAFAGRLMKRDDKAGKYINSPESELYHKSKVLYGLFQAKNSIRKKDRCFLVEGYTDVLSLVEAGIDNVVASSGTALTAEQIQLIKRFTSNITVVFDGDAAGIRAAIRGIDILLEEGMNIKALSLPDNMDPDEFVKSTEYSTVMEYIEKNQQDFLTFKIDLFKEELEKNTPTERAAGIKEIIHSVAKIENRILRETYIREAARLLKIKEETLFNEVIDIHKKKLLAAKKKNQIERQRRDQLPPPEETQEELLRQAPSNEDYTNKKLYLAEKELIKLLLKYGDIEAHFYQPTEQENENEDPVTTVQVAEFIKVELESDEMEIINPLLKKLYNLYFQHFHEENFDITKQAEILSDPKSGTLLADLLAEKEHVSKFWDRGGKTETAEEIIDRIALKTILEYKQERLNKLIDELKEEMKKADEEKEEKLLQRYLSYKEIDKELNLRLGERVIKA